jgi:uncharacterized membrane protein YcaP (DUF421 family)
MPEWDTVLGPSTPLLEVFVRQTATYLGLLVLVRVVGQRESGGLGINYLLVVVLIAEAASSGIADDYRSVIDGLLLVATILLWSVAVDAIAYR